MARPSVHVEGRAVVRPSAVRGFVVLLPDGEGHHAESVEQAEALVKAFFARRARRHRTEINVGLITWEGCKPPAKS